MVADGGAGRKVCDPCTKRQLVDADTGDDSSAMAKVTGGVSRGQCPHRARLDAVGGLVPRRRAASAHAHARWARAHERVFRARVRAERQQLPRPRRRPPSGLSVEAVVLSLGHLEAVGRRYLVYAFRCVDVIRDAGLEARDLSRRFCASLSLVKKSSLRLVSWFLDRLDPIVRAVVSRPRAARSRSVSPSMCSSARQSPCSCWPTS